MMTFCVRGHSAARTRANLIQPTNEGNLGLKQVFLFYRGINIFYRKKIRGKLRTFYYKRAHLLCAVNILAPCVNLVPLHAIFHHTYLKQACI
jgi:hypothetical protein